MSFCAWWLVVLWGQMYVIGCLNISQHGSRSTRFPFNPQVAVGIPGGRSCQKVFDQLFQLSSLACKNTSLFGVLITLPGQSSYTLDLFLLGAMVLERITGHHVILPHRQLPYRRKIQLVWFWGNEVTDGCVV